MKPKQQVVAFVSIIIVVLISMVCIIPGISLIEFYKNESQSISRFDVLNKELFNQIPAPKGAVEIEQFSTGIISPSTEHGRYLSTNYRISENSTSEILKYYDEFLLSKGWKVTVTYKDYYVYSHGTACVNVSFYGDKYSLNIWYDFWNQEFSPINPNSWLLKFLEFGESTFALCPP